MLIISVHSKIDDTEIYYDEATCYWSFLSMSVSTQYISNIAFTNFFYLQYNPKILLANPLIYLILKLSQLLIYLNSQLIQPNFPSIRLQMVAAELGKITIHQFSMEQKLELMMI